MNIEYERIYGENLSELNQICEMEKRLYGEHALGSIDIFGQLVDEKLGGSGIIVCAKDTDIEKVVGYYLATKGDDSKACFVAELVEESYRGKGIGYQTKIRLIDECLKEGFDKGLCTIAPDNVPNISLHLNKLSWVATGWTPNKYGEGENRFYFDGDLHKCYSAKSLDELAFNDAMTINPSDRQIQGMSYLAPMKLDYDFGFVDFDNFQGVAVIKSPEGEHYIKFEKK